MPLAYILDTSAFIYGMFPDGELLTPPKVYAEVKDAASALKRELLPGLVVREPESPFILEVREAAHATGDDLKLSPADVDLLALAAEERAGGKSVAILTDDYAVQNVARKLGIEAVPLQQKRIKYNIVWEKRCMGCNRTYPDGDVCMVCGSPLKLRRARGKGHEKR